MAGNAGDLLPKYDLQNQLLPLLRCGKQVLQAADRLSDWSRPKNAEDLAFFKGGQCWFYSVGHERIAAFLHATEEDLRFVRENGLAEHPSLQPYSAYYDACDEALLTAAN